MSSIIDQLELDKDKIPYSIDESKESNSILELIKLIQLQDKLDDQMKKQYQQMNDKERERIKELFAVPSYVTVKDAASIIDVTPQMIRKYCMNNKLKGEQTMPGSGKWRIETKQLMNYPGWNKFLRNWLKQQQQSKKIAEFMNEYYTDMQ
ncbi:hypothetical protein ACLIA0_10115 [Bacillaceae bacterium W0354]